MKVYKKILGVVLVALAIQLTLAAVERGPGNDLISRAITVTSNIDSIVSRAITVTSNINSIVSRAITVTSNIDSIVSRAITVNTDCNDNGIPDQCDIECGKVGGQCYVPGCGASDDCDANGIPDECEPDCNVNGVVDACDITNGTSQDANNDGVPDECIDWIYEDMPDGLWNTPTNWEDGQVPGDGGPEETESPAIEVLNTTVILDLDVNIDSLILGPTATLKISQGDLTIDSPNGIHNRGDFTIFDGFAIIAADSMVLSGTQPILLAGPTASLTSTAAGNTITNQITLQGEGLIEAHLINKGQIVADAPDGTLAIADSIPGPLPFTNTSLGTMEATNGATLSIERDLTNDGLIEATSGGTVLIFDQVTGSGRLKLHCPASPRGGCTPPIGHIADAALFAGTSLDVLDGATFEMLGTAELNLTDQMRIICGGGGRGGCTPPIGTPKVDILDAASVIVAGTLTLSDSVDLTVSAGSTFALGGDFNNWVLASQSAATFDWASGPLTMDSGIAGPAQALEAAGRDDGDVASGYIDNFAIGTLELAADTTVNLVDDFVNQDIVPTACEALYVDTLVLNTGAVLDTGWCNIYYNNLQNAGGIIVGPGDFDRDGDVDLVDYSAVYDCHTGPGVPPDPTPPTTTQQCLDPFDADHDQDLDLFDIAHFQRMFTGS